MNRNTAILINEGNLSSGIVEKNYDVLESGTIWHKIFIRNALHYDRDFVLRVLMEAVHPHDFIPVKYVVEGDNVSFLIKNCSKAIREICNRNLCITNPNSATLPFKVAILLRFGKSVQVDVQSSIMKVLQKRYNHKTRHLNLTAFYKDPDLAEYCPLSQPKLLYFVLHLSKSLEYRSIKLNNNDIELMKSFEAISSMRSLVSVDLRKNKINSFDELQVFHHWPIVELFLEDNPVCDNCLESTYIKDIRQHCPKIQKIDGFTVPPQSSILYSFRRNYLCDKNGFDLVEQFVEHYFSIYDSSARGSLESMYTKTAYFTITATYIQGCPSFSHAKLGPYINFSHNINRCADMSKTIKSVHIGAKTIAGILTLLPNTEHDPQTFTVDLLYYSEKTAIICVTGVFREPADSLLEVDRMVGFVRTFVLTSIGNNAGFTDEYVIINEMVSVFNASASQEARAFRSGHNEVLRDSRFLNQQHVEVAPARTQNDETDFIDALMKIAGLNSKWARKCLQEANFDLQKALNLFVDLYKLDKIPDAAFLSQHELAKLTATTSVVTTPLKNLSPTESSMSLSSIQPLVYMPPFVTDERANPYSDDPFDTSRPYEGIDRNQTPRWSRDNLDRERERELERERSVRERERELEVERAQREREKEQDQEWTARRHEKDRRPTAKSPPRPKMTTHSISPGKRSASTAQVSGRISSEDIKDQFGRKLYRSRSRSVELVETIDLDASEQKAVIDNAMQVAPEEVSTQQTMSLKNSAPETSVQQSMNPATKQGGPSQVIKYEISMSELTEYENQLSNIKEGNPNQQQKVIKDIMDKLFAQYPHDVKVWLLAIGTHYKRQMPQRAREMKNRAIRAFINNTPQLSFQIKLAAAQMEMEYVTGPTFSQIDKKVGEQNFLNILQQSPNNINIAKMYITCLLKRYAKDESVAW